jgi:hypothetical protein
VRYILRSAALLIPAFVFAGDGRSPRSSAADYPVHNDVKDSTIAAVRLSADQLNKTFPSDLAKKYVVLEIAVYPKDGAIVDVRTMDFSLRIGDGESRPEDAQEVATMWRPHGKSGGTELPGHTRVTTETGVIVGTGTDPNTGRRTTNAGTYEKVGVASGDDPGQARYPTNSSNVDYDRMEALLNKWALQDGKTSAAVAGYVYFPLPLKKTKGAIELQYSHEGSTTSMTIPAAK